MAKISIQTDNMDFIVSCTDVEAKRILQQVVEQFTQWRPPCKTSPSDRKTKQVMKE